MFSWWMFGGWGSGTVPQGLRPVVAAVDAPQRYAVWRATEGMLPDALACDAVWPDAALLCLRVWEEGKRRWVTEGDLGGWELSIEDANAHLAASAAAPVAAAELVRIEGMDASYLRIADGDGWSAAGLLRPDLLVERLGGLPIRVAVPSDAVLLAWRDQGPEVDRVMAVGVRELYDSQPVPVSPRVFGWNGRGWAPFGQAIPTAP